MAVNGIEIEVGQKWVTRGGHVAAIVGTGRRPDHRPHWTGSIRGTWAVTWNDLGSVLDGKGFDPFDLVKLDGLWYKAPQPESDTVVPDISAAMREAGRIGLRLFADTSAYEGAVKDLMDQIKGVGITPPDRTPQRRDTDKKDVSGGGKLDRKSNYYQVHIQRPVDPESEPYLAECADIIEALNMTFNEGEAFKALWRLAAARLGKTKVGGNPVYDADKASHYGARTAAQTRAQQAVAK